MKLIENELSKSIVRLSDQIKVVTNNDFNLEQIVKLVYELIRSILLVHIIIEEMKQQFLQLQTGQKLLTVGHLNF